MPRSTKWYKFISQPTFRGDRL